MNSIIYMTILDEDNLEKVKETFNIYFINKDE